MKHSVLKDLTLKDNALDAFELPLEVRSGYLRSLSVKIPWTRLNRLVMLLLSHHPSCYHHCCHNRLYMTLSNIVALFPSKPYSGSCRFSSPVQIIMDGLFLLCGPPTTPQGDTYSFDQQAVERRARALKQRKLKEAELLKSRDARVSDLEQELKQGSFQERLLSKIVQNVQFTCTNGALHSHLLGSDFHA